MGSMGHINMNNMQCKYLPGLAELCMGMSTSEKNTFASFELGNFKKIHFQESNNKEIRICSICDLNDRFWCSK